MRWPGRRIPAGFKRGKTMYSYDNGETWEPRPRKLPKLTDASFTVTSVDHERGVITLSAKVRP